ncbi:MAG: DUF1016 N-terminal domain-containing protein, partial [Gemmatimonadota bacterium]
QTYPLLLDQIEALLTEGKVHSRRTAESAKVEAYWHIGDALQSHLRDHPRAEYGQQTIRNLSKDLGLSASLLWDLLLYRRSLPILYASRQLGWTHVRAVLRLPTQDRRYYYLRAADQGGWTTRQLRAAIKEDAYGRHTEQPWVVPPDEDPQQGVPLRARFGELHTYMVLSGGDPAAGQTYLDLGFSVTVRAAAVGLLGAQPDQLVTVDPASRAFTPRPPPTPRYTYVAWVQRVIDGDTLVAVVDLGLDHQTRPQRFRLRGIDCPELGTRAGRNARAFVQDALAPVGFVVLTTHKTDNYGRYLADIRYLPGQPDPETVRQRGHYLNRQLLDQHLARRYER